MDMNSSFKPAWRAIALIAVLATAGCDVANSGAPADTVAQSTPVAPESTLPTLPELTGDALTRHQDLQTVKAALEKYAADHAGTFPATEGFAGYVSDWGPSLGAVWIPELVPAYLPTLPRDPANSETTEGPIYIYRSDGKDYKLLVHGYGACSKDVERDGVNIDPLRTKEGACWAYGFWSPGGVNF
jgi:hypothetical protein